MTNEEALAIFEDNETVIGNPNYLFTEIAEAWDKAIEALKAQKRGKWIKFKDENGYTKFMCSNCRFTRGRDKPKHCPNCGADNRGREA